MANTKVKFYNLTSEQYKNLSAVDPGGIYFLNDAQGLFVGNAPIVDVADISSSISSIAVASISSVTQVFEATDPTGSTPVDELFDTVKGDATPKEGDIFIVTMTLAGDKQTKAAYTYNDGNWVACAANVDASKVILTKDITLAGSYSSVGNIKLTDKTLSAAGRSVVDVFTDIFDQTINPEVDTTNIPYLGITMTNSGSKDVGTQVTPTITITYYQGKIKTPWNNGSVNDGTALDLSSLSVDIYDGDSNILSTVVGKVSIPYSQIIVGDNTKFYAKVRQGVKFTTGTNINNNKGEPTEIHRAAGTIASNKLGTSPTITGYRPWFMYIGTDNTTPITGTFIRSTENKGNDIKTQTEVRIPDGTTRIMVAIPVGKSQLKTVIDVDGMGLDMFPKNFAPTLKQIDVPGSGTYATTKQYNVWCSENNNGFSETRYTFTFG